MLGKLLKYDFKALGRVMLPLQGGVLLAGIVGSFMVNFSFRSLTRNLSTSYYSSSYRAPLPLEEMINATTSMLAGLFFAVVFASMWVTLFLIARHLHKSFLKDEGYLTFTLPVTANMNLLSKTIAGAIWMLINALILIFVVVLLSLVGFSDGQLVSSDVWGFYGEMFRELSNAPGVVLILELILLGLLAVVLSVLQVYSALIMGASIARTHKVLVAVGLYVALSFAMQMILSVVTIGSGLVFSTGGYAAFSQYYWFYSFQPFVMPIIIVYGVFVVVLYLLSKHLLKTKLNLD